MSSSKSRSWIWGQFVVVTLVALTTSCLDTVSAFTSARRIDASAAIVGPETFFGPVRVTRQRGAPVTETHTIYTDGFEAPFVLHVVNGNPDGSKRVSSGIVSLDGEVLLKPRDFNQHAAGWEIPVTLGASATLSVTLRSAPGSFIDVWITGVASSGWTQVSVGGFHTCAMAAGGAPFCWGFNNSGTIGDGTSASSSSPVAVSAPVAFASLSSGREHTCALGVTGSAYCWGGNIFGAVGDGTTVGPRLLPVAVLGGLTFASLTGGGDHTCGITTAGAAYCWGRGDLGQLGNGSTAHSSTPSPVAGGHAFASLSAGHRHTCGVTTSGVAYCWGLNSDGQLGDGTNTNASSPVAVSGSIIFANVSGGLAHTCGVSVAGAGYCWGLGGFGSLGNGGNANANVPTAIAGSLTLASIVNGDLHSCGLTTGGAAWCWGENGGFQLGNGTTISRSFVPVAVVGGLSFTDISSKVSHTCGVTPDRLLYCWGFNNGGQLGDGTTTMSNVPVQVPAP